MYSKLIFSALLFFSPFLVHAQGVPDVLFNSPNNPKPASGFFSSINCVNCSLANRYLQTATTTIERIAIPYVRFNSGSNWNRPTAFQIVDVTAGGAVLYDDQDFEVTTILNHNNNAGDFNPDYEQWQQIPLNYPVVIPANHTVEFVTVYDSSINGNATNGFWVDDDNLNPKWRIVGSSLSADQSIYAVWFAEPEVVYQVLPFPLVENLASTSCVTSATGTQCQYFYTTTSTIPTEAEVWEYTYHRVMVVAVSFSMVVGLLFLVSGLYHRNYA